MKKLIYIALLLLISRNSFGAELLDVKILETTKSEYGIEIKMQVKNPPKEAFFFVDITKDDSLAFEKLVLITQKMEKGDNFKLNLSIPSFSLLPSGSYYRSSSVFMSGTANQ